MKLLKAILVSICTLPLAAVSYAEDIDTQNLRISETSMMSVNDAAPSTMKMHNENDHMGEKPQAIKDVSDVEVDKERAWHWPWKKKSRPCGSTDCWPEGR